MKVPAVIRNIVRFAFVAAEMVLYCLFMFGGFRAYVSTGIKYASVIVCAGYALLCCHTMRLEDFLLLAALVLTVVSDYFLLVTMEYQEVGLIIFTVAHLCHFARTCVISKEISVVSIAARVVIPVIAIVVLAICGALSLITALVAVYFPQLVVGFFDSCMLLRQDRKFIFLAVGFFLFMCCDICVGIYNFSDFIDLAMPDGLVNFASYAMWAFYLPSQVIIVLSGGWEKREKRVA